MSRRSKFLNGVLLAGLALVGCDNQKECAALTELHYQHQHTLAVARSRAGLADRVKGEAEAAEKRAKQYIEKYGVDVPKDEITAEMQRRVDTMEGASLQTEDRTIAGDNPGQPSRKDTVWLIKLPTRSFAKAADLAKDLSGVPPLLQWRTLLRRDGQWVLELSKSPLDRVPFEFKPVPIKLPPDASSVPAQVGFCGADEIRKRIRAAREEIESLKDKAAEATVALPTQASWEGLRVRAQLAVELESVARAAIESFLTAATRAQVEVKAIGQEEDVIILEISGGPKERGRIQRNLPEDLLVRLKYGEDQPGVVRFFVSNRLAEKMHGHEEDEPRTNAMGMPTPDELKKQFDKARKKTDGHDH